MQFRINVELFFLQEELHQGDSFVNYKTHLQDRELGKKIIIKVDRRESVNNSKERDAICRIQDISISPPRTSSNE